MEINNAITGSNLKNGRMYCISVIFGEVCPALDIIDKDSLINFYKMLEIY